MLKENHIQGNDKVKGYTKMNKEQLVVAVKKILENLEEGNRWV